MFVYLLIMNFKSTKLFLLFNIYLFKVLANINDFNQYLSLYKLADLHKCPACYGDDFCNNFVLENLTIFGFDQYTYISNLFGVKNVYFGWFLNDKVVLKKLGSDFDLEALDNIFATYMKSANITRYLDFTDQYLISAMKKKVKFNVEISGLLMCPSNSKFDYILAILRNKYDAISSIQYKKLLLNTFSTIHVNPEPILLQLLDPSHWPIPRYIGNCGRIHIQTYMGPSLENYWKASWKIRGLIVIQLLNAAKMFTFSHEHFRFYLLDVSFDNIAVNENGTATFIDLENIILLDKADTKDLPVSWNETHHSEVYDCSGVQCFGFSIEQICAHHLSDHNYYMICDMLFSGHDLPLGFLHSLPDQFSEKFDFFQDLFLSCVNPMQSNNTLSRFTIADQIILALEHTLAEFEEP